MFWIGFYRVYVFELICLLMINWGGALVLLEVRIVRVVNRIHIIQDVRFAGIVGRVMLKTVL